VPENALTLDAKGETHMSSEPESFVAQAASGGLDWRAILHAAGRPFLVWAAAVLLIGVVAQQPGIVCLTPLAWALATWVGTFCVLASRRAAKRTRLQEAAVAGALSGLAQGLLFLLVMPLMGATSADEAQRAQVIGVILLGVGVIISSVLSLATGAARERRRAA
jgi:uncharacterized membrane protein